MGVRMRSIKKEKQTISVYTYSCDICGKTKYTSCHYCDRDMCREHMISVDIDADYPEYQCVDCNLIYQSFKERFDDLVKQENELDKELSDALLKFRKDNNLLTYSDKYNMSKEEKI